MRLRDWLRNAIRPRPCEKCAGLDLPLFAATFHATGHPDLAQRPNLERSAIAELAEVAT